MKAYFPCQWVPSQVTLHHSVINTLMCQRFGISSSASPQTSEKETNQAGDEHSASVQNNDTPANAEATKTSADISSPEKIEDAGSNSELVPHILSKKKSTSYLSVEGKRSTKQTAFHDR